MIFLSNQIELFRNQYHNNYQLLKLFTMKTHIVPSSIINQHTNINSPVQNSKIQRNPISSFIEKTYQILQNPEFYGLIQWLPNGQSFIIHNIEQFQEKVLPKYFRHRNLNSFVRQLNMHGFHKSRNSDKYIYFHTHFLRGQKQLLSLINRKSKIINNQQEKSYDSKSPYGSHAIQEPQKQTNSAKQQKNDKKIAQTNKRHLLPAENCKIIIPQVHSQVSVTDHKENLILGDSKPFIAFSSLSFISNGDIDPFGQENLKYGKYSAFSVVELNEQDCSFKQRFEKHEQNNDDVLSIFCEQERELNQQQGEPNLKTEDFLSGYFDKREGNI